MSSASAALGSTWARARDILALGKPRLSGLVIFTTGGGLVLAPGHIGPLRGFLTLLATTLLVGSANALNSYIERESDREMHRTRNRPLASGRVEPWVALVLGIAVGLASVPALAFCANPLTAVLGVIAWIVYVAMYTPLKKKSTLALVVGAVPGAIPPLMGWTAVTGEMSAGGWALFAILFFWQLPHFLAVSCYLRDDYARGGLRVFSIVHGDRATKICLSLSVVALIPASYLPVAVGMAGPWYLATVVVLGAGFFALSLTAGPKNSTRWARGLFMASLWYLTVLFVVLMVPGS